MTPPTCNRANRMQGELGMEFNASGGAAWCLKKS
jgi:hypothetical protein